MPGKINRVGEIKVNSEGYTGEIVADSGRRTKKGEVIWQVKMLESGNILEVVWGNFKLGYFKDYESPAVCGVGYIYKGASRSPFYSTWKKMIYRCYDPNNQDYERYGGRGVRVCDDWLHFENFERDVKKIPNYEKRMKDPKNYTLDKDIRGNSLLYSKENCMWATRTQQNRNRKDVKKVVVIDPFGNKKIYPTQTACIKNTELTRYRIRKMLHGDEKEYNGYIIMFKDEYEELNKLKQTA